MPKVNRQRRTGRWSTFVVCVWSAHVAAAPLSPADPSVAAVEKTHPTVDGGADTDAGSPSSDAGLSRDAGVGADAGPSPALPADDGRPTGAAGADAGTSVHTVVQQPVDGGAQQSNASPAPAVYRTVVTGQRGLAIGESPIATTAIYPQQIEALTARTSDDVLRSIAEVQMPRADSAFEHPTAQSVSIRGVGAARTLVLFDGVPVNDAFGSWILWNKVPLAEVERVEVVRGAAANVYGNLAMGGVVQLFRRPVSDDRLDATAEYGTDESYRVGADGTWKVNDLVQVTVFGQSMKSDGFYVVAPETRGPVDRPEPFDAQNAGARVDIRRSSTLNAFVSGDYYLESRTAGTALTTNGIWLSEGAGGFDYRPSEHTLWRVRAFGSTQDYTNVNSTISSDRSSELPAIKNDVPSTRVGGSAIWSRKWGERHVLSIGVDVQQASAVNHDLVYDAGGNPLGNRVAGGKQLLLGAFAEWVFKPTDRWILTAGLRGDLWRNYAGSTTAIDGTAASLATRQDGTVDPRLTAVWRVTNTVAARAGAYTGFRAPTLNELYRGYISGGVTYLPNSSLGAERLAGGELGVDWSPTRALRSGLTGYVNDLFGLVQSETLNSTTSQRENLGEARSAGLEADVHWRPSRPLTFTGSYALTYTRVVSSPGNAAIVGDRLPGEALHRGALTAELSLPARLTASGRVWSESLAYADDRNTFRLPAFAVVDLSVARRLFDQAEIYASVTNLLDSEVVTSRTSSTISIGSPRMAWIGLRLKLRRAP